MVHRWLAHLFYFLSLLNRGVVIIKAVLLLALGSSSEALIYFRTDSEEEAGKWHLPAFHCHGSQNFQSLVFLLPMISFLTNIWNQLNRYFHSMSPLIVFLHEVRSTMVQIELKMDQEYLVLAEFLFAKFWGTPFPPLRRMFLAENTLWIWGISLYGKNPPNSI